MRLQLASLGLLALLAAPVVPALADDTVTVRAQDYREPATKVFQPTIEVSKDIRSRTNVTAHYLLDSISAASVAAGSQARFTENRHEFGLSLRHLFGDALTVLLGSRYSQEPDYKSLTLSAGMSLDLAEHDTTIAVNLAHTWDSITDSALGSMSRLRDHPNHLGTQFLGLTWSQVLTPNLLGQLGGDLAVEDGYQANPYRAVSAGAAGIQPERVPSLRLRTALAANLRWFEDKSEVTVHAAYRLYIDDWGVLGHTPELSLTHDLGRHLELRLRYRYYTQGAADFYRAIYDTSQEYMTDDVKLSPFVGHTLGARVLVHLDFLAGGSFKRFAEGEVSAVYEHVIQKNRFGNADVAALGLVIPY